MLIRRFESGLIPEAILGDGSMFIGSVTDFTSHDRILVISQLFAWADSDERKQLVMQGLSEALRREVIRGEISEALDIVWCALILADEQVERPPVDWKSFSETLDAPARADPMLDTAWVERVLVRLDARVRQR